LYRFWQIGTSS